MGCNLPHRKVKRVHMILMSAASLFGLLGVVDMWIFHADNAQTQLDKKWAVHFQSAHSWLGFASLLLFLANWCSPTVLPPP